MDTTDLEKTHGADFECSIASLEVLCIRQLHKQGCDFAAGDSDGAVIQHKYLMDAQAKTTKG